MSQPDQKVVQYLNEAHASEVGLVSVLKSQIAMTPRGGSYRDALEKHLDETRTHAQRIQERLGELEQGRDPLQAFLGLTESLFSQTLALSKTPFDLLRGSSREEKVLKNAKDACATESLEIATYTALERLASNVGDERTAKLAASIRGDEERMLERIMRDIPKLTDAVVGTELKDEPAIARYDSLTAEEIVGKLPELSQIDLAKVDSYERKNDSRTTVLNRIAALRAQEPWPGYDELPVAEIEAVLGESDEQRTKDVVAYERSHKNRAAIVKSAAHETANA